MIRQRRFVFALLDGVVERAPQTRPAIRLGRQRAQVRRQRRVGVLGERFEQDVERPAGVVNRSGDALVYAPSGFHPGGALQATTQCHDEIVPTLEHLQRVLQAADGLVVARVRFQHLSPAVGGLLVSPEAGSGDAGPARGDLRLCRQLAQRLVQPRPVLESLALRHPRRRAEVARAHVRRGRAGVVARRLEQLAELEMERRIIGERGPDCQHRRHLVVLPLGLERGLQAGERPGVLRRSHERPSPRLFGMVMSPEVGIRRPEFQAPGELEVGVVGFVACLEEGLRVHRNAVGRLGESPRLGREPPVAGRVIHRGQQRVERAGLVANGLAHLAQPLPPFDRRLQSTQPGQDVVDVGGGLGRFVQAHEGLEHDQVGRVSVERRAQGRGRCGGIRGADLGELQAHR